MHIENPFYPFLPDGCCERCFNTGFWLAPSNKVLVCPRILMLEPHAEMNEAAKMLDRALNRKFGKWINPQAFELARILTLYTTTEPLKKSAIFDLFWSDTELESEQKLRKFHALIEELRKDWLLPVGSRKAKPCGYWICTDLEDYKAWFESATAAPITQLTTIHRNPKANFPVFAEQVLLGFWNDLNPMEEASQ